MDEFDTIETPRPQLADRCWQCERRFRGDERTCARCGATRVMAHEEGRLADYAHRLAELMEADRAEALAARLAPQPIAAEDAPTRRPAALLARLAPAGHGPLVSAHGADLLLATAYGALGAFIGAGLWCVVATLAHALLGPLGLVMAFLTGKGTAMTATFRSSALVLVAVALTALSWDVCAALLTSQGAALSPLDAVFCLISLFVAAAPVDFLPRRPA